MSKARMYGAFAPYTPNNKQDLRYRRKAASTATIPGRCKDCRYWSRNEIKDTDFGTCFNVRGMSVIKREDGFCDKWRANNEL